MLWSIRISPICDNLSIDLSYKLISQKIFLTGIKKKEWENLKMKKKDYERLKNVSLITTF